MVTTPVGVIFRMVLLPQSATKTLPDPSTVTLWGSLKRAAAPVLSVLPDKPAVPASVVTTPVGVIFRMVLLPKSATKCSRPVNRYAHRPVEAGGGSHAVRASD